MGIKGPLGISLTNTEQTHCFLCKVGVLHLQSPVLSPEKNWHRQHRHSSFSKRKKTHFFHVEQRSPTFSAPGTGFVEDNFSTDRGWGEDGPGGNSGDGEKLRWRPAAQLLLCRPVPNRMRTSTCWRLGSPDIDPQAGLEVSPYPLRSPLLVLKCS